MDNIDETGMTRQLLHDENIHEGRQEADSKSKDQIKSFVDFHDIKMNEFQGDIDSFRSYNDFFIRKLKHGARPIAAKHDPTVGSCIGKLLDDEEKAKLCANGAVASFRLAPQDYHRYHSPVRGKVDWLKEIDGTYYGVDPTVRNSALDELCMNARTALCIKSDEFG
ncbi:hypothetical protein BZG36_05112 [Bifiguratus adelaidae]|uniref:Phosphatidylserine decarboxylase n=1 Tax=Bifiguratus adelaidae TaxID=1938954 RepID=A0A261XWI8_9FUNG|nr:hypothetical protein BZG36_05112 [Bifiguratus adelaidae]